MFTSVLGRAAERVRTIILAIDVVVACLISIKFLDLRLARYVAESRDVITEMTIRLVPDMGSSSVLFSLVLPFAVVIFLRSDGVRANRALLVLGVVATAHAICGTLKFLFGRARPDLLFANGTYSFDFWRLDYAFHSFPSGHAAVCAGLAVVASRLLPSRRLMMPTIGFAFAFVPVVTGLHYMSDALLGFGIGAMAASMFEALMRTLHLPVHDAVDDV